MSFYSLTRFQLNYQYCSDDAQLAPPFALSLELLERQLVYLAPDVLLREEFVEFTLFQRVEKCGIHCLDVGIIFKRRSHTLKMAK